MKDSTYNFKEVEGKWLEFYERFLKDKKQKIDETKVKYYILDMFSYPSGVGLHVGHTLGYVGSDVVGRYKRMLGMNVFHPMGFDTFGLPAERYAFANKLPPEVAVTENTKNFMKELKILALLHDKSSYLNTSDPAFYKWTQWCFLKFFNYWYNSGNKRAEKIDTFIEQYGKEKFYSLNREQQAKVLNTVRLAYLDYDEVNWCDELNCILANEELDNNGNSIVGGYKVVKRRLLQWKLRITAYAERLLASMKTLDWPDGTLKAQANWIGRDEIVSLYLFTDQKSQKKYAEVDIDKLEKLENISAIILPNCTYNKLYCPASSRWIPIENGDKVQVIYRKTENTTLKKNKKGQDKDNKDGEKSSLSEYTQKEKISRLLDNGFGRVRVKYNLRDWTFSRQRYWGEPIPILYKDKEWTPIGIDETALPLKLPPIDDVLLSETTTSKPDVLHVKITESIFNHKFADRDSAIDIPLNRAEFWNTLIERGEKLYRETNIMPQWAGSSWYYIRYLSPESRDRIVSKREEKYWLNNGVDLYIGGREHSNTHLLYARFWHKFLYDIGVVSSDEPFSKLRHQGYITANAYRKKNGEYVDASKVSKINGEYRYCNEKVDVNFGKMGKSLKNAVSHSDLCTSYGTDAYRLHILYGAPLDVTRDFQAAGIVGMSRFLKRVWRFATVCIASVLDQDTPKDAKILELVNSTIVEVGRSIDELKFNIGIAYLIKLINFLLKHDIYSKSILSIFTRLLHPYAPLITEEIWKRLGYRSPIFANATFPDLFKIDPKTSGQRDKYVTLIVQINGRKKCVVENVDISFDQKKMIDIARQAIDIEKKNNILIKDIFCKKNVINFII